MLVNHEKITDISSLISAIRFASKKFEGQVWWRGQRNHEWPLKPSVFRSPDGGNERFRILRFQQKAISRHPKVPPVDDRPAWLFLMQHYRLPTRLLDWTESPLIGSYFATEIYECHQRHPKDIEDPDGALFALSPYVLNEKQINRRRLLMPEDDASKAAMAPAFDATAREAKQVIAIRPSEVDVRLMVQLSVFTLNGYDCSLDDLDSSEDFLVKFRIPREAKTRIRSELKQLGITLSNIFPDLEHLAQEIGTLDFKYIEQALEPISERPTKAPHGITEFSHNFRRGDEGST